jgi:hypothetical protein
MASTNPGRGLLTYAQNFCCGAERTPMFASARYQRHSVSKSLIYMASLNCFFFRHFKESLVLQGSRVIGGNLSTKLSTENLKIFKAPLNQALRTFFASAFEDLVTTTYVS